MKKILLSLIALGSVSVANAATFQDFNNNIYAEYQLFSPNGGAAPNFDQWGLGGTIQTKNNVWMNANAVSGTNQQSIGRQVTLSNLNFEVGYAFQYFGDDDHGFQLIPHAGFAANQASGANTGNTYTYSLGVKPEYRFMNSLKFAVDMNLVGAQIGDTSQVAGANFVNNGQNFGYSISPGIQYNATKDIMVGLDYVYFNSFNSSSVYGANGNNILQAKVGYLF